MIVWVVWETTGTGLEGIVGGWGVAGGVGDEDVRAGGDTGVPVPTGGMPVPPGEPVLPLGEGVVVVGVFPLGGAGLLVPLGGSGAPVPPGEFVLPLPLEGPGVLVAGGGAVVPLGGESWLLLVLLPLLLPPGLPVVGAVC